MLEIRCGWCSKPMGVKDGKGVTGITHSICDSCLELETRVTLEVIEVQRRISKGQKDKEA